MGGSITRVTLATAIICISSAIFAADAPPLLEQIDALRAKQRQIQEQLDLLERARGLVAEGLPDEASPALAEARRAYNAAEEARKAADVSEAFKALNERFVAARKERDAKAESLATSPRIAALRKQLDEAKTARDAFAARKDLTIDDYKKYAVIDRECRRLERTLHGVHRALWTRGEVEPLYKRADGLYQEWGKKTKGVAAFSAPRDAEKKVREAEQLAATENPIFKALDAERTELAASREKLVEEITKLRQTVTGTQEWTHKIELPRPQIGEKKREALKADLWIPPDCKVVRGIIMGHPPMIGTSLLRDPQIRVAAALNGLAAIRFENLDALFDYSKDTPEWLEKALAEFATKSNHPELKTVPWLTVGHSTSGIFARNVAYWKPERVIGVIHIKSGNFHQHRPDPAKTLVGVPLLAVNGEFEEFGPEGGIRKEYGAQTQWVMAREQILRFRASNTAPLSALVVHPGGGHGDWNEELSRLCALFVMKAAQARLPEKPEAGEAPQVCRELRPEAGWLMDADLTTPSAEPAPFAEFKGNRERAFWLVDGELAKAITEYHRDRLLLDDPTVASPVPADWPKAK